MGLWLRPRVLTAPPPAPGTMTSSLKPMLTALLFLRGRGLGAGGGEGRGQGRGQGALAPPTGPYSPAPCPQGNDIISKTPTLPAKSYIPRSMPCCSPGGGVWGQWAGSRVAPGCSGPAPKAPKPRPPALRAMTSSLKLLHDPQNSKRNTQCLVITQGAGFGGGGRGQGRGPRALAPPTGGSHSPAPCPEGDDIIHKTLSSTLTAL